MEAYKLDQMRYLDAWILTTRPKTLILSIFPFLMGTIVAASEVMSIQWHLMIFGMLSAICIQIGTNFINDVYDFKNKVDKATRLGPKRGIHSGTLNSSQVFLAAISCFVAALLFGIPLVLKGGVPICLILLSSVMSGYIYTAGPKPLAYNGLGELFVLIFFGLVSAASAYFFQTGQVDGKILIIGLEMGLLACAPMAINNLRDIDDDRQANKNTLAVLFGKGVARVEISVFVLLPFILNLYFENFLITFLPWLALPIAYSILSYIWKNEPSEGYNNFLFRSILLYVLFNSLLMLAILITKDI